MSVWNNAPYIVQSVDSILQQSFQDFEFIIMDDRGSDNTVELIEAYDDPRITLHHNPKNMGISASLNRALELAKGRYIAIMDGDDIALPEKLSQQIAFMDAHPEIGILGTSAYHIDANNRLYDVQKQQLRDEAVRYHSLIAPAFYHPSCMYRAAIIKEHNLRYDATYKSSLDHHFWCQLLQHCTAANLEAPLLCYRIHQQSSSIADRPLQTQEKQQTAKENITRLIGEAPSEEMLKMVEFILKKTPCTLKDISHIQQHLLQLTTAFFGHFSQHHAAVRAVHQNWLVKAAMAGKSPIQKLLRTAYLCIRHPFIMLAFLKRRAENACWKKRQLRHAQSFIHHFGLTLKSL